MLLPKKKKKKKKLNQKTPGPRRHLQAQTDEQLLAWMVTECQQAQQDWRAAQVLWLGLLLGLQQAPPGLQNRAYQ